MQEQYANKVGSARRGQGKQAAVRWCVRAVACGSEAALCSRARGGERADATKRAPLTGDATFPSMCAKAPALASAMLCAVSSKKAKEAIVLVDKLPRLSLFSRNSVACELMFWARA